MFQIISNALTNLFSVISALDKVMSFNSTNNVCEFVKNSILKERAVRAAGYLFKIVICKK